ncbi:protein FAM220A [Microcebus murinus]|uniref:protein FAM220A n=1 Tax=Microcebus murinus TaxID=30608 RepID=UPI000642A636|nr:protein FAM220A [Microcebus murinus]XP_012614326.1 protein FAM220A [Microcebus murinus]
MRDRRKPLGTCLEKVKWEGGDDSDKQLYSLKKRTQEESPCPADTSSWMNKLTVDVNGNSQTETLSLQMKNDLSGADLLLHNGNKVLPYLKESIRRNSASAATPSKTVGLFSVPAEECFPGVSCCVVEALRRNWLGRGPKATDGHRGQCSKGKPWVSGLPCYQELLEMGIFKDDPSSAFPERLGCELEPSCLRSVLSAMLHANPEVLLNDETKHVFLEHLKPAFSEQTIGYREMLSSVKSTSNGLQITWRLLAL